MNKKQYIIRRTADGKPDWESAQSLAVDFFFEHSSAHRPRTTAQVLYDDDQLYIRFVVADRYVRAVGKNYQDPVYQDSCVEFFVQPKPGGPYFNFEVNAGGCMLLYAIPVSPDGLALMNERQLVPFELVKAMNIQHSLPERIEPEIVESCDWTLEYNIPFTLFEHYLGSLSPVAGQIWRANFYKCADETSHPHWGMWSPITDGCRFHRPEFFGRLVFES